MLGFVVVVDVVVVVAAASVVAMVVADDDSVAGVVGVCGDVHVGVGVVVVFV